MRRFKINKKSKTNPSLEINSTKKENISRVESISHNSSTTNNSDDWSSAGSEDIMSDKSVEGNAKQKQTDHSIPQCNANERKPEGNKKQQPPPPFIDHHRPIPIQIKAMLSDNSEKIRSEFYNDSTATLHKLKNKWGIDDVHQFNITPQQQHYQQIDAPLSKSKLRSIHDAILLSESWNKILAFRSMFAEALVGRWRVLVAADQIQRVKDKRFKSRFWAKRVLSTHQKKIDDNNFEKRILQMIESNRDPIAKHFGMRTADLETLTTAALDAAVRELCPHHQVVQREAYRPLMGSADPDPSISNMFYHENECTTFRDYCHQLARYGVLPRQFLAFAEAFLWAMKEHNPYSLEDEVDDLDLPTSEGVHARFIAGMFVLPIIEVSLRYECYMHQEQVFQSLKKAFDMDEMKMQVMSSAAVVVDKFFHNFPDLINHFSASDIDELKFHLYEL